MNFALLFLIVSLVIFGAVGYYFAIVKNNREEEENREKLDILHKEIMEKDEKMIQQELHEVHEQAQKILSEAQSIAQELIDELESATGKKSSDVNFSLPDNQDFEKELGSLSDRLKNNYVNRIKTLMDKLERFEYQKAQEVQKFAEEQQVTTDVNLQKKRVEALSQMHERIEKYKKEELAIFDRKVIEVVDQAAMEVLGHQLTNHEHGELIAMALKRARAEKRI